MAVPGQRGLRRARSGPPRRPGSRQRSSLIVGRRGGELWGAGYVYDNVLVTRSSQGGWGRRRTRGRPAPSTPAHSHGTATDTSQSRSQPRHSHGHSAVTGTAQTRAQRKSQRSHGTLVALAITSRTSCSRGPAGAARAFSPEAVSVFEAKETANGDLPAAPATLCPCGPPPGDEMAALVRAG